MRDCNLYLMLSAFLMILFLFSGNVFANENETDNTYQLKEIVVSATRAPTPMQDVAANITVVDKEAIEKMPAATVAEVLQYVPGVSVEFEGNIGSRATIRIQGSETRQVAVYMDGVPLNQLANPSTDLNYVPVDIIERIEVYKGAASSAWGSSLGGVINIIKCPDIIWKIRYIKESGKYQRNQRPVRLFSFPDI
jgi:vitamin B12 transporter